MPTITPYDTVHTILTRHCITPPPPMQFFAYANAIEMVPAIGADNTLALANQAAMSGGCDCVLLSPELVRDKGANSLVNKLKASGHRCVTRYTCCVLDARPIQDCQQCLLPAFMGAHRTPRSLDLRLSLNMYSPIHAPPPSLNRGVVAFGLLAGGPVRETLNCLISETSQSKIQHNAAVWLPLAGWPTARSARQLIVLHLSSNQRIAQRFIPPLIAAWWPSAGWPGARCEKSSRLPTLTAGSRAPASACS